jgi:hypothetical protein
LASAPPASAVGAEPPSSDQVREATRDYLGDLPSSASANGSGGLGEQPPADTYPGPNPGTSVLDGQVMVALYGAPQLSATILGRRGTAKGAVKQLRKQIRPYKRASSLPVTPSINLIGTIATADAGRDGKYRTRQSEAIIADYLERVRAVGGRLTLDIQPGRSPIMHELRALRKWIAQPDVDVGIDPEWNVGKRGVPGRTEGKITNRQINKASAWIQGLVEAEGLPPKAMIVHQFRADTIKRPAKITQQPSVDVALNFDGIGSPRAKRAGYANLAEPKLFDGFSLFYSRDTRLLKPRKVLRLEPSVEYAMYQ